MSRHILSRYESGQERVVVGWDHPCGGAFWQEFNDLPPVDSETGEPIYEGWEEVLREGGMWPGLVLDKLVADMPEEFRPLVTDHVMRELVRDSTDSESGRIIVDHTKQEEDA